MILAGKVRGAREKSEEHLLHHVVRIGWGAQLVEREAVYGVGVVIHSLVDKRGRAELFVGHADHLLICYTSEGARLFP